MKIRRTTHVALWILFLGIVGSTLTRGWAQTPTPATPTPATPTPATPTPATETPATPAPAIRVSASAELATVDRATTGYLALPLARALPPSGAARPVRLGQQAVSLRSVISMAPDHSDAGQRRVSRRDDGSPDDGQPEVTQFRRLDETRQFGLWRRAVVTSAALAATSAVIGHWASGQGDEAYDRYLSSAGETRRERAFDDAERYDRIAGAAFLAMEAGLVLTAYFVFF